MVTVRRLLAGLVALVCGYFVLVFQHHAGAAISAEASAQHQRAQEQRQLATAWGARDPALVALSAQSAERDDELKRDERVAALALPSAAPSQPRAAARAWPGRQPRGDEHRGSTLGSRAATAPATSEVRMLCNTTRGPFSVILRPEVGLACDPSVGCCYSRFVSVRT